MKDITNECLKSLDERVCSLSLEESPRVYIELEGGKWPKELGEEPTGYSDSDYEDLIQFTLGMIERRIGMKAILRAKKEKEGYTPQMFDDWWHSEFSGRASINTILEQTEEIVEKYSYKQRKYERNNMREMFNQQAENQSQKGDNEVCYRNTVIEFLLLFFRQASFFLLYLLFGTAFFFLGTLVSKLLF